MSEATNYRKLNRPPFSDDYKAPLNASDYESTFLAYARSVLSILWILLIIPPLTVIKLVKLRKLQFRVAQFFLIGLGRILGLKLEVLGQQSEHKPTLYVANHTSYLDIIALGAATHDFSFISKREVRSWPFFGQLALLQDTAFIDRVRAKAGEQKGELLERLDKGESLMLFPEGTTNDGNSVLPFKSALFALAYENEATKVQPVSITYVTCGGLPLGREWRPFIAWYGDMTLGKHLWQFLKLGRTKVVIEFHEPVCPSNFESRKMLCDYTQQQIKVGVKKAFERI